MSEFHYVRTQGPDGGVDVAEGDAIGIDLASVLDDGLPPLRAALFILAAVAEILAIAAEDGVVHGNLCPADVFLDDTGAVSLAGFGHADTVAPERRPVGPQTDRFGLGRLAYALLSPQPLAPLPDEPDAHENAAIDAILALDLTELPDEQAGDVQWYLARLLAWEPADRPTPADTWRAMEALHRTVIGPDPATWCQQALEGGGQRRDRTHTLDRAVSPKRQEGPVAPGAVDFGDAADDAGPRSTGAWTRDGMKQAIQRASAGDSLVDPRTDWMAGTPLAGSAAAGPRAPTSGAPPPPRPTAPPAPRAPHRAAGPEDSFLEADRRTEVGVLAVPTAPPKAPPPRPARTFRPDPPTVPAPVSEALARTLTADPPRPQPPPASSGPRRDPDTAPQLVQRVVPADEGAAPSPGSSPASPPVAPAASPAPPAEPAVAPAPRPLTELRPSTGPDPFQDLQQDDSSSWVAVGAVAVFVLVASAFCVGVGGVAGVATVLNLGEDQGRGFEPVAASPAPRTAPRTGPRTGPPTPSPRADTREVDAPTPVAPRPTPRAARPVPAPSPAPVHPAPTPPTRSFTTETRQPTLPPAQPRARLPEPEDLRRAPPLPTVDDDPRGAPPLPTVAPDPRVASRPAPASSGFGRPPAPTASPFTAPTAPTLRPASPLVGSAKPDDRPPLPLGDDDSILPLLLPTTPSPEPASAMQNTMRGHLAAATAARDAVINGDPEGARAAAASLEFINTPQGVPPNWQPYIVDMKMEAWLMKNSPDLPAAAYKVAQIGQACAACHAGVHAGPTVTPNAVPPRSFADADVMKQHAWAADWLWVGLLANDPVAWQRGATELDQSPFPSVALADFPEQKFMDLEDRLHQLANEAKRADTPQRRGDAYAKLLSTCSRCHDVYREFANKR